MLPPCYSSGGKNAVLVYDTLVSSHGRTVPGPPPSSECLHGGAMDMPVSYTSFRSPTPAAKIPEQSLKRHIFTLSELFY